MIKRLLLAVCFSLTVLASPRQARADVFGGDIVILTQILAQAIQTVLQLKSILENGQDTLNLLRDVNAGVRSGLDLIRIINPRFDPGVFGDMRNPQEVLRALEHLYGSIPQGANQELIQSQDQSVAEVVAMNRNLFDYADQVDRERDRIIFHAQMVSPQGAGKLQGQALGVLIGVMTQLLRTQSQMLKIMAQNMAYENRKEKLSTKNFQDNYKSLSNSFGQLPTDVKLPKLGGGQ